MSSLLPGGLDFDWPEETAIATSGSESTQATGDQFIIWIDLTAGGGEVVEFNKALAIEPRHIQKTPPESPKSPE